MKVKSMECPKCKKNMERVTARGVIFYQCKPCNKLFFEKGNLDKYVGVQIENKIEVPSEN